MFAGEPDGSRTLARRTRPTGGSAWPEAQVAETAEASRTAGSASGLCGTVRRWRGAAVSPRVGRRWVEGAGVAGYAPAGYGAQAVQIVSSGPGLVPGAERRVLGPFGEPAGRARPATTTVVAVAEPGERGMPGQHVLRVVPQ